MYYINKNAENKYTLKGCIMRPHENTLQAKIVWMSDITNERSHDKPAFFKSTLKDIENHHWKRYWHIEKDWEKLY